MFCSLASDPALFQLYATGYGAGGRLGIGGTESVSTPTLLESIQHVFIRKVAVNSGGKHCLALSSEGEVYSWGEAEDGKLGHGNRRCGERGKCVLYTTLESYISSSSQIRQQVSVFVHVHVYVVTGCFYLFICLFGQEKSSVETGKFIYLLRKCIHVFETGFVCSSFY